MKRFFQTILIALFILNFSPAQAKARDNTDKYAHGGLSFAITTASYGGYKVLFGKNTPQWQKVFLAAATSMAVGLIKEAQDPYFDNTDILANGIGTAASAFCILVFDF